MTKIFENGQLEWTFEDIDFSGAIEDIMKELDYLKYCKSYLNDKINNSMTLEEINLNHKLYESVSKKVDLLFDIWIKLNRLSAGLKFNG